MISPECAISIVPDYAVSSHGAPLGMVFNTGTGLPAAYSDGASVSEYGSCDRSPLNGYKVVFVRRSATAGQQARRKTWSPAFFGRTTMRGRPLGLAMDRTGGLLIADDLGNAV